jgi:myo-inositol-1(or 4)-monophosphatase
VHSLALRMARTAAGRLDIAFASAGSHDWDLAAADLIVHEADGALTGFDGARSIYNSADARHGTLVAAGRARHARAVEIVREWRPGHER